MTKGDMAPENAQDEGITHGKKTGAFAFVGMDREVPTWVHGKLAAFWPKPNGKRPSNHC